MWPDFSLLDRPHILAFLFYPRPDWSPPPEGAEDLTIPVADGVSLSARLYTADRDWPVILFFHGNGEVVADYDAIAPLYHGSGLNLLVVDYRGYGRSGGRPTVAALHADAHRVKAAAFAHLDANGYRAGRYLMGRSLGALPAVELAATDAGGFRGLILESGAAGMRGLRRFAAPGDDPAAWQALAAAQQARLAAISLPLLTIHGARDELVPLQRALETHELIGSADKELVIIPEAGHNDLLARGRERYFQALAGFVARHERRP